MSLAARVFESIFKDDCEFLATLNSNLLPVSQSEAIRSKRRGIASQTAMMEYLMDGAAAEVPFCADIRAFAADAGRILRRGIILMGISICEIDIQLGHSSRD